MIDVDEALAAHMRELEFFHFGTKADLQLSEPEILELQSGVYKDAAIPPRRGRPVAHRSKTERTFQSYEVFVFVVGEMRIFKMRHGLKQVPARVQNKFIEFAKRMSPEADDDIVLEHLRKDQGLLPHYDEPTSFQVVRHQFETGEIGTIIIAGPADERSKRCLEPNKYPHSAGLKPHK